MYRPKQQSDVLGVRILRLLSAGCLQYSRKFTGFPDPGNARIQPEFLCWNRLKLVRGRHAGIRDSVRAPHPLQNQKQLHDCFANTFDTARAVVVCILPDTCN